MRGKNAAALPIFHRLRPLTSITESDAQISGGETRQDLKIPGVSPWWLLVRSPVPAFRFTGVIPLLWPRLSHSTPDTRFREGSSLQAGLYARTPVQSDCCAFSGNYQLESNPERHDKAPLAAATGKQDVREMYREFLKWWPDCGYTERTDLVTCLAQDCYHG